MISQIYRIPVMSTNIIDLLVPLFVLCVIFYCVTIIIWKASKASKRKKRNGKQAVPKNYARSCRHSELFKKTVALNNFDRIREYSNSVGFKKSVALIKKRHREASKSFYTLMSFFILLGISVSALFVFNKSELYHYIPVICIVVLGIACVIVIFVMISQKSWKKECRKIYIKVIATPVIDNIFISPVFRNEENLADKKLARITIPSSSDYDGDNLVLVNGEKNTQISNVRATHLEEHEDRDGHKTYTTVTDFCGQVLMCETPYDSSFEMYVVPTSTNGFFHKEYEYGYAKKREKGLLKIDTEDIFNNENYNIYTSDELMARRILNPLIVRLLNEWRGETAVSFSMKSGKLCVAYYTNKRYLQFEDVLKKDYSFERDFAGTRKMLLSEYALADALTEVLE